MSKKLYKILLIITVVMSVFPTVYAEPESSSHTHADVAVTPIPTFTPEPTPTASPTPSPTPIATSTPIPTNTPIVTLSPEEFQVTPTSNSSKFPIWLFIVVIVLLLFLMLLAIRHYNLNRYSRSNRYNGY